MAAWYTYPIISHFGQKDREGNYWQPDANIATPDGTPVTMVGSGVVTSAHNTDFGQGTVTVRLDVPINALATHFFFEHLNRVNVSGGQRVSTGSLIGSANAGGIFLGFGFYSGDVYGSNGLNKAWDTLQNDLKPGGKGLLNPTSFLDALRTGKKVPTSGTPVPTSGQTSPTGGNGGTQQNTGAIDPGGILSETGQWIAINLFKEDATLVHLTNSFVPYQILGAVAFAFIAALIAFIFITLIGL